MITGIGVVAPNGIGKEEFWRNCATGVSGIKPITLFDAAKYRCRWAGEVSNFQPEGYLGSKGLRNLDRTTLLTLVAAKLAIDDAKLEIVDEKRNDIGVVLGSTMGSVHSISEFDKEGLREGPRYVNPAKFPNTVINSPASQVAIRFGIKGLNSTISTGFTAGLDAVGYALDMLHLERAKALLVGGVEELCLQTYLGFYKSGLLATAQNGACPQLEPLKNKINGTLLGEGAAFFVLEELSSAVSKNRTIYAEILGYASAFHNDSLYRYDPEGKALITSLRGALAESGILPENIDFLQSGANAVPLGDRMEAVAIQSVFGENHKKSFAIKYAKALLGEAFSASGAMQLAAGLNVLGSSPKKATNTIGIVDAFGPTGVASTLVLRI